MTLRLPLRYVSFFLLGALWAGCDQGSPPPTLDDVPPERRVAFAAVYDRTDPGGAPIHRVVVADFDDPSTFAVVSRPDHLSLHPRLSRDGQRLLFGDRTLGPPSAEHVVLYDLRTGQADSLLQPPRYEGARRTGIFSPGEYVRWDREGGGFYFSNPPQAFSARQDALHYRLADGQLHRVRDAGGLMTFVVGVKWDTLLVFSSELGAPGWSPERPAGIKFMDRNGAFIGQPESPCLTWLFDEEGNRLRHLYEPAWNETLGLIAYRMVLDNPDAHRGTTMIAVCDLDGHHERTYHLDQQYVYRYPRWGPGRTVLLERNPFGVADWRRHEVVVLDLDAGSVREWASPSTFGAAGMRTPDAGER